MSKFELIEFQFDPDDFSLSLEDDFLIAKLTKDIEGVDDADTLKQAALKLLNLAVHRQAVIRGLIRRISTLEAGAVSRIYEE
jgi:hypothetical protein